MNTHHRIDHLAFDLTFTAGGLDMSRSDALRALVVERLLPVVVSVFDTRAPGDAVVRIDQLDVDLGDVAVADLPEALAEGLSDALEQVLAGREFSARGRRNSVVTRFSSAVEADAAELVRFLRDGRLPAHAATALAHDARKAPLPDPASGGHSTEQRKAKPDAVGASLEALLARVMSGDVEAVRRLLLASGDRDVQMARLVRQFPAAQIEALLHALRPAEAQRWLADLHALDRALAVAGWEREARASARVAASEKLLTVGLTPLDAGTLQMPWHEVWEAVLALSVTGTGAMGNGGRTDGVAGRAMHVLQLVSEKHVSDAPAMLTVLRRLARAGETERAARDGMERREGEIRRVADGEMRRPRETQAQAQPQDKHQLQPQHQDQDQDQRKSQNQNQNQNQNRLRAESREAVSDVSVVLPTYRAGATEASDAPGGSLHDGVVDPARVARAAAETEPSSRSAAVWGESDTHREAAATDIGTTSATAIAIASDNLAADDFLPTKNDAVQPTDENAETLLPYGPSAAHSLARIRNLLANALTRGQAQALYDIWPHLMADAPALLRDALHHYAAYPDLRDRMAMSLPVSLLSDMLSLLQGETLAVRAAGRP